MQIDLRLGDWRTALAGETCDTLITDPPYGGRVHTATNDHIAGSALPDGAHRMAIAYQHWAAADVHEFIASWAPRTRGWMACMTSDDLAPAYRAAYEAAGLYPFAPVPIIQRRPRLVGDGPASWTVYLMVARPRNREFATWGCLPGAYLSRTDHNAPVVGAKPIDVMRHIIRDYTHAGDVVCDPCAGGAATLIAAAMEGRIALGSEADPATYKKAKARIAKGITAATLLDGLGG